jgi:DNA adenine methylase
VAIVPIFRWAGSKRKLLPILRANVSTSFKTYIEPFAGSACLFFDLEPTKAILGDFNAQLIQAYTVIARSPERVHAHACAYSSEPSEYYRIRAIDPTLLSPIKRASRFLYLNRFCFNGVYRTNKTGLFNVPRGRDTGGMPSLEAILAVAKVLQSAQLIPADFQKVLRRVKAGDFVYLDPPYAKADEKYSGEYGYGAFSSINFPSLLSELAGIDRKGATFLLSYRYSPQLRRELSGWHSSVVSVKRHVAGFTDHRTAVRELLVSNVPLRRICVER